MGRVGVGFTVGARVIGSRVVFGAVFGVFRLIILEEHVGQTKLPDFHALSYIIMQNCGKGGS